MVFNRDANSLGSGRKVYQKLHCPVDLAIFQTSTDIFADRWDYLPKSIRNEQVEFFDFQDITGVDMV